MENNKIISCCGVVCSGCQYYPECPGCPAIEGDVFWLKYVDNDVCPIYDCCVKTRKLSHCGRCAELPCAHYCENDDPNVTPEQRAAILDEQLRVLRSLD